jgi:uncharacterized protein YndB with AHSA1/START domain
MKRDLKFERTYPHPIERVWAAVTDSEAIAAWLMSNDFKPEVGHRFQFRSKPQPGWNGIVDCEVLTCDPPREVSYRWVGGPLDTVLRITLAPADGGTHLRLEHNGFRGLAAVMVSKMMGSGWGGMLEKRLPAVLEKLRDGIPLGGPGKCTTGTQAIKH